MNSSVSFIFHHLHAECIIIQGRVAEMKEIVKEQIEKLLENGISGKGIIITVEGLI